MPNIIISTEIDGEHVDVGDLLFTAGRHDSHTARFTYDTDFIRRGWPIDPTLRLDDAPHDLPGLPLAVEDAAPDSWGQMLLQRGERHAAEEQRRHSRKLTPDLFLLAASDATRQGALRFRVDQDGPFLAEDTHIPKTLELSDLLAAADAAAADPAGSDWAPIEELLDAGSSALGGARPKAAVLDDDGALWLAKFPQVGETTNVPVWEMTALDIAERACLPVPERKLLSIGGRQVLLVRRFDRSGDGQRLHYISTRTLLGARNLGEVADYGGRRGIAARLANESVQAKTDLRRLWRQAALNVLINNTDNHLRNHGLLRAEGGWLLAPVFDLDPNPDTGTFFNTTVGGGAYRSTALRGLVKIAAECELDPARARTALGEVHDAVSGWDADASRYGATPAEIELMAGAFTGMDPEIDKLLGSPSLAP